MYRTERTGGVIIGGLLIFGTYLLILWASPHLEKLPCVLAYRQSSVVLAVFGGVLFYKELGGFIRVFASTVMVAGLFLEHLTEPGASAAGHGRNPSTLGAPRTRSGFCQALLLTIEKTM